MKKQTEKKCTNKFEKKGKILKNSNYGITLIALVITIIVLLILAGISISILSGDNSILSKAGDARDITGERQIAEKVQLAYTGALTNGQGEATSELINAELNKFFSSYTLDFDNKKVTIDGKDYNFDGTVTLGGSGGISSNIPEILKSLIGKDYSYIEETENGIIELGSGETANYLFCNGDTLEDYIIYDGNMYKVVYEDDNSVTTNVYTVNNVNLSTFGVYEVYDGKEILVTPCTPEKSVHEYYEGPTTFSNIYYLKNDRDLDLSNPFNGYVTYDEEEKVDGCYDNSRTNRRC